MGRDKNLSIVIPFYNGFNYIKNTVNTLCLIKNLKEIVIVDDGTPINKGSLYEIFSNAPLVRIYRKDNSGIADTRNFGLSKVTGEFVLFADQDDEFQIKTIETAVEIATDNNSDAVLWSTTKKDNTGFERYLCEVKSAGVINRETISSDFVETLLFSKPNRWLTCAGQAWGGVFRVHFLVNNNICFNSFVDYEDDYLFTFNVFLYANRISLINDVGYRWRVNNTSFSHNQHPVDDYVNRRIMLRSYIENALKKSQTSAELRNRYVTMTNQKIPIDNIYNLCKSKCKVREILNETKLVMQNADFIKAYQMPISTKGKYYCTLFILIRSRLILLAVLLSKYLFIKNSYLPKLNHP